MPTQSPSFPTIAVIGVLAGVLSGLFGIGGGIAMIPLLVMVAGLPQRQASATSLAAIIPTATVAAISYLSSGVVPVDQVAFGLVIAVAAASAAPLGALALRSWNITAVRWVFIGTLLVTAIMTFVTIPDRSAQLVWAIPTVAILAAVGALMGFTAGLLGLGGGVVAVPLLVMFGVSDLTAKTLSLVAMVPAAVSGTLASAKAEFVQWRVAVPLGIITTASAPLGVWLSVGLPVEWANPLLAALVLLAAAQLAVKARRETRIG